MNYFVNFQRMDTNSLLTEIENFNLDTKPSGNCQNQDLPPVNYDDIDIDSDEFDEIINRKVSSLEPDRREVPGRSPRPSAVSPFSEDDDWEARGQPPTGMRLGPIGQEHEEQEAGSMNKIESVGGQDDLVEVVKKMEEDQEELTSNLMALTSHYAKVQLRLQQVVAAPNEAREELLKDLEDFAFRGIPNMRPPDMNNKTLCLVKVNTC